MADIEGRTYEALVVERHPSGVTVVTMNRPEQLNRVDGVMHKELRDIWLELANDYRTKVVVLTGAGRAFCAGGDLKKMAASNEVYGAGEGIDPLAVMQAEARRIVFYQLDLEQPLIAAINGDAIGLGASLALGCDITICAETARIADPHVKMGLVAGDGGAVLWPLLVGPAKAKEFLIRGTMLYGPEAERIGLVNYSVPTANVLSHAMEIAEEIALLPPMAVRFTKLAVNRYMKDVYQQTMDTSIALELVTFRSEDHKEAARAFSERRPPNPFQGR